VSTKVVVSLSQFEREFNEMCDRLELKYLQTTNHRAIANAITEGALIELHRAFIYEVRRLQARLKFEPKDEA
jgi:hypothetical protein